MKKTPYASALSRFLAYLIDIAVIVLLFFFMGLILGVQAIFSPLAQLPLFGLWWYGAILICPWLYFSLMESSAMQATIGKQCLQLCVADLHFQRIGFWRATGRYFGKLLSRLLFFFGFVMILITKKRQGLHDKITRTVILSKKKAALRVLG